MIQNLLNKITRYLLGPISYARSIGVNVGDNVRFISWPDFGSEPYLISIGNHVTITSNVTFITHDGATWCIREQDRYKKIIKYGRITIFNNCFIGKNSTIMPNVVIGPNAVVAAGSIVTKNVKPNMVYGGVPAHPICRGS